MVLVSFTVSAVILGMALSNLPFGFLADRLPIHPIILAGGIFVALGGLVCVVTRISGFSSGPFRPGSFHSCFDDMPRGISGKDTPGGEAERGDGFLHICNRTGGMGGRFLGGWIHPPLHWRYALVSASVLILVTTFFALRGLPRTPAAVGQREKSIRFIELLKRWETLRLYFCAAAALQSFHPFSTTCPSD